MPATWINIMNTLPTLTDILINQKCCRISHDLQICVPKAVYQLVAEYQEISVLFSMGQSHSDFHMKTPPKDEIAQYICLV